MFSSRFGLFRAFPPVAFEGDDGGGGGGDAGAAAEGAAANVLAGLPESAVGGGQGGGSGGGSGSSGGGDDGGDDDFKPLSVEEQKELQRKHNDARAKLRQKEEAEKAAKRKKDEEKGEHEKIAAEEKARADRYAEGAKGDKLEAAVKDAAREAATKFTNPDLAWRLIDRSGLTVDFDEETGKASIPKETAKEIAKRLGAVLKENPGLGSTGRPTGTRQVPGAGNTPGGGVSGNAAMNAAIRQAAGR